MRAVLMLALCGAAVCDAAVFEARINGQSVRLEALTDDQWRGQLLLSAAARKPVASLPIAVPRNWVRLRTLELPLGSRSAQVFALQAPLLPKVALERLTAQLERVGWRVGARRWSHSNIPGVVGLVATRDGRELRAVLRPIPAGARVWLYVFA
jgi:hypothetical protein